MQSARRSDKKSGFAIDGDGDGGVPFVLKPRQWIGPAGDEPLTSAVDGIDTFGTSSLEGLVSSKRRLHWPSFRGRGRSSGRSTWRTDVEVTLGLGGKRVTILGSVFQRHDGRQRSRIQSRAGCSGWSRGLDGHKREIASGGGVRKRNFRSARLDATDAARFMPGD